MNRAFAFVYGVAAYVFFIVTFLYAVGFVGNLVVPKTIDSGTPGPLLRSVLVNLGLLSAFAVQHTVMARPAFKNWWTRYVPQPIERSTFVIAASACLLLLYVFWQPLPRPIWSLEAPLGQAVLWAWFAAGWAMVLYSSFLIDHFDLFGLRQVYLYWCGRRYTPRPFMAKSFYRLVRHPLMLGFLIAFWSTPHMSAGHLLFAAVTTVYILVGVRIEEQDLVRSLGDDYRAYRRQTPMLLPRFWPYHPDDKFAGPPNGPP